MNPTIVYSEGVWEVKGNDALSVGHWAIGESLGTGTNDTRHKRNSVLLAGWSLIETH